MTNLTNIKNINTSRIRRSISYTFYLLLGFVLFACSDDLEIDSSYLNYEDGSMTIEFVFPEAEHVVLTRSNDGLSERKVNKITLLFFDNNGNLKDSKEIDSDNIENINRTIDETTRTCTVRVNLDGDLSLDDEIYAVANTEIKKGEDILTNFTESAEEGTDLEKLMNLTADTFYDYEKGRIMSGKMEGKILSLRRVSAKLTLKDLTPDNVNFELIDYEGKPGYGGFSIYNSADKCYVMAGEKETSYYNKSRRSSEIQANKQVSINNDVRYDAYALPTKTYEGNTIETYVVIKASYNDEECYYAIPLYDNKTDSFLNIEPNHWYEMTITDVLVKGAPSAEEAIKNHNFNQIMVEIHDHAAMVLSMVSDGIHELGVTRQITFTDSNQTNSFTVKCYAADTDQFDFNDLNVRITEGRNWFEIEANPDAQNGDFPYKYTQEAAPDRLYNDDQDNPGTQLTFSVKIKEGAEFYSDAFGTIEVTYRGLKREVYVYYNSAFNVSTVCTAELQIIDNDGTNKGAVIQDYWTFVKGYHATDNAQDDRDDRRTRLYGIRAEKLVDNKIRTRGFHFPMPYGFSSATRWEYVYTVDFSKILEGKGTGLTIQGIEWEFEPSSDRFIKDYIKIESVAGDKNKIKLTLDPSAKDSYNYAEGKVSFTITLSDNSEREITSRLYHTGFFHYEADPEYVPSDDYGYYYYEVKPLAGINPSDNEDTSKYWLDRNLGAKSNLRFIDNENIFDKDLGDPDAAGRFYKISDKNKPLYADPTFSNFRSKICPPGYHIPQTQEWNAIRMSENFMTIQETESDVTIITSYFYSGSKTGNVYFPKARYYQGVNDSQYYATEANSGDTESGYYWTRTLAQGMEKENMGNWLRALYINGTSTNYNNANIEEHKLNVRCVAGDAADLTAQVDNYISLSVHHATHVYIFDKNSHSSLHPFPGKAIGTSKSAYKWQYFSSTTSVDPSTLAMAFVYVSDTGEMTIYSRNGNKFAIDKSMSEIMNDWENLAWDVETYKYKFIDFCSKVEERDSNISENQPNNCDEDVPYDDNQGGGGGTNDPVEGTFKKGDEIIFYWSPLINNKDYPNIFAWSYNESSDSNDWVMGGENWDGYGNEGKNEAGLYKYTINSLNNNYDHFTLGLFINSEDHINVEVKNTGTGMDIDCSGTPLSGNIDKQDKGDGHSRWVITLTANGSGGDNENKGDGTYSWEGSYTGGYSDSFDKLTSTNFNWEKVAVNSVLTVSYTPQGVIDLRFFHDGPTQWEYLLNDSNRFNYKDSSINPIILELTEEILNDLKTYNGLRISGVNFTLTKITITAPE